jgi:hypothetical protein
MHTMSFSSSYVRALAANLPIFALFAAWLWHRETEPGLFGFFVALVLGFVPSLIVALFVGMFLRSRNEIRSWLTFGSASLAGWIVLLFLAIFLTPSF